MSQNRQCLIYNCGIIDYQTAWKWQKSLQQERIEHPDRSDVLILLEHPPVYTLGTGSSLEHLKFVGVASPLENPQDPQYALYRVERGGEVTYHCPGQIVAYPILNLRYHQQDLHWYLRQLEQVIISVLALHNLTGARIDGLTGVWIDGQKVAAIGIKVSKWITMHGFALNVCPDLSGFDRIVPCGIVDRSVTSMSNFIPNIDPNLVRHQITTKFAEIFELEISQSHSFSKDLDNF
jgi:lipoyl(octanoyl) transferase